MWDEALRAGDGPHPIFVQHQRCRLLVVLLLRVRRILSPWPYNQQRQQREMVGKQGSMLVDTIHTTTNRPPAQSTSLRLFKGE